MNIKIMPKIGNSPNFKGTFLIDENEADKFLENKNKILPKNLSWNFDMLDNGDVLILTTKSDIQKPIDSKIRKTVTTNPRLFDSFRLDKQNVLSFYSLFDFKLIKNLSKFKINFEYSPIKLKRENYKSEKAYQSDFNMLFNK